MFCTKCGAKLPDGAKFCTKCGAPAGTAPSAGGQTSPVPKTESVREVPAAPRPEAVPASASVQPPRREPAQAAAPRPVQAPPPEPPRRTPREPELPEEDGSRGGGKTVGIVVAILAVAAVLCVCIVLFLPKLLSGDKGAPKATPDPVETSTPKPASTPAPEESTEPRPTEPTTPATPAPTAQVVELVTEEKALDLVAAAYNCAPKLESSSGGVYTIACYRTGTVDLATKETAYTGYLGGVTVDAATGTISPLPGDDPAKAGEYLFPTDKTYITPDDLDKYTHEDIILIRNEIYARYGYNFQDEKLQDYFNSQSWYTPVPGVDAGSLGTQDFNEYERANVDTIIQYEKDKGWK